MNVMPYIIRCYHLNLPVLISKSSSTRNAFVQTFLPILKQKVEDGSMAVVYALFDNAALFQILFEPKWSAYYLLWPHFRLL